MNTDNLALPSNKKFGLFFATIFGSSSAYCAFSGYKDLATYLLIIFLFFLCSALLLPKLLTPLNSLWMRFGLALGYVVTPIVLGVIFFLLISPTAIISKFLGRDLLRIKQKQMSSYWIERDPVENDETGFKNQF